MIRSLLVLAVLLLWASPAHAAHIVATYPSWDPGASYYIFEPTGNIDDYTVPFSACPSTTVTYHQEDTAVVTAYATEVGDDTPAEIEANPPLMTLDSEIMQPVALYVPNELRFVVDTAETVGGSFARVYCSKSVEPAVVVTRASDLPATGSISVIYKVTTATNGTDCDNLDSGLQIAHCGWTGSNYAAIGVASAGLTNPLTVDLEGAGKNINNINTVDGRDVSVDGAVTDAFKAPYDKILHLTDRTTACAQYTAAFEEYHDGTAPPGNYRVKVTFDLTGAQAMRPNVDFYDDGGQWPYKACFIHHPALAGSYNGNFPDTLGRLTPNAGALIGTQAINVMIDVDGQIAIDKTGMTKNALVWDVGGAYLAGCDEGIANDDLCGDSFYGYLMGAVRVRGNLDVRISTQNDGAWTGEGTPSMSKTARLAQGLPTFMAILANNGGNYSDFTEFTINPQNLGHTDIVYHQVNSWGTALPNVNTPVPTYGIGAMFYGFINTTGAARDWVIKNMDHGILLGDQDNGGYTVTYQNCDALDMPNGTCGLANGVSQGSVTTGVNFDGLMIEGGAGSYSSVGIPIVGFYNSFMRMYAEQTPTFNGIGYAIGPQYCSGTGTGTVKPRGTMVANDADCSVGGTSSAAPAPSATLPHLFGELDLNFIYGPINVIAGVGRNILLGDGCVVGRHIRIGGARLDADNAGNEFTVSNAIATSGGCALEVYARPAAPPYPSYYGLTENWSSAKKDDQNLRCNDFMELAPPASEDIGKGCNDAYAAMVARGYGGQLQIVGDEYVQQTRIDFCDETGVTPGVPVVLTSDGAAGGNAGRSKVRLKAGTGVQPPNVAKTNYQIVANVDAFARDAIFCSGCNFRTGAFGIRRGDIVETVGFANAANNYGRGAAKNQLVVYRAGTDYLILEDEKYTGPTMANQSASAVGDVRKLGAQVEMCHHGQRVEHLELDGDSVNTYADINVFFRPDNAPNEECTASLVPYPTCTGLGTGTALAPTCIHCGIRDSWLTFARNINVALKSTAHGGQADHFLIENSYMGPADVNFWSDDFQAKPVPVLRDTQLEAYRRNAVRVGKGGVKLDTVTAITNEAPCASDTYGPCRMIEMGDDQTYTLLVNDSNLELLEGDGLYVSGAPGPPGTSSTRMVSLVGTTFNAIDADATSMSFVNLPKFCGTFVNSGNRYINTTTAGVAPTVTVSNSDQSTCPLQILGKSSYQALGGSVTPTLTITDGIPSEVMENQLATPHVSGLPSNPPGARYVDWTQIHNMPIGFVDGSDDGGGGGGAGVTDGDKGDVTVSGGGAVWNVDGGAIPFSELIGSATDSQIPDTITIAFAAGAGTANAMSGSGQIDDNDLSAGAVDGGVGGEIADASITFNDLAANSLTAANAAADMATQAELDGKSLTPSTSLQVMRFLNATGDVQGSPCTLSDAGVLDCDGTGTTCLVFRDSDNAGDTACAVLNGAMSCQIDTNEVCGDGV